MFQEIIKKHMLWSGISHILIKTFLNQTMQRRKNFSEICFLCSDCSCGLVVLL